MLGRRRSEQAHAAKSAALVKQLAALEKDGQKIVEAVRWAGVWNGLVVHDEVHMPMPCSLADPDFQCSGMASTAQHGRYAILWKPGATL